MRLPLPSARARWTGALAVGAAVLAGTLAPVASPGTTPAVFGVGADKWAHAVAFGLLAAVVAVALDARTRHPAAVLGPAFLCAVLLGAGVEAVQPAVGRTAQLGDLLADAVGAGVAVAAYRLGHRWVKFE